MVWIARRRPFGWRTLAIDALDGAPRGRRHGYDMALVLRVLRVARVRRGHVEIVEVLVRVLATLRVALARVDDARRKRAVHALEAVRRGVVVAYEVFDAGLRLGAGSGQRGRVPNQR